MASEAPSHPDDSLDPWPGPVTTHDLLDEIAGFVSLHLILQNEHCAPTIALWILHSWAIEAAECTPILAILSPTMRCGKTTALDVVSRLARRARPAANITPAALFRYIEKEQPTLLIDEADTFLKDNEELRGVLNAGYSRQTGYVVRTVGANFDPREFSCFCTKALAMIGEPHATLLDRSIPIRMRRKTKQETIKRLRGVDYTNTRRRCMRWADDHMDSLISSEPRIPDELSDRGADLWEPLLAIAETGQGGWRYKAFKAAVALSGDREEDSRGVQLLADIRHHAHWVDGKCKSVDLIADLVQLDESPWGSYYKGNPINSRQLANLLRPFDIYSKSIRIDGKTPKGYERSQFEDAFSRYLPSTPSPAATTPQLNNDGGCGGNSSATPVPSVADRNLPEANAGKGCGVVADKSPLTTIKDPGWAEVAREIKAKEQYL